MLTEEGTLMMVGRTNPKTKMIKLALTTSAREASDEQLNLSGMWVAPRSLFEFAEV